MEERKHIDRLYQEKFKDFEATPREMVWKNISSRLQEKQRKQSVLPIWYRIAGVAAVLALFFNFATNLFKSSPGMNAQVAATAQNDSFGDLNLTSSAYTENMLRSSIILQALMMDTQNRQEQEISQSNVNSSQGTLPTKNPAVFAGIIKTPQVKGIASADYTFSINSEISNNTITAAQNTSQQETVKVISLRDLPVNLDKEQDVTENVKNVPSKRLRVTTTAAPIYFDNMGSGSSIDARFANNESSGEISMSYGINFAYQLSEKVKLRSGISKVDLSYNTRNIAFTATVNPSALSGIDYRGEIPKYRIENNAARPFSNINASTEFNRSSLAAPVTGFLNQRLGFIEVPLELEYVIIDKRIGLNLIGGGSTLILDENMISLNSSNFSTNLGQANNLNNVSFSTNIGIGLDYKISPQFQLNLEPIFKYQINTFSSGQDLNPYFFGIYSGFSFRF